MPRGFLRFPIAGVRQFQNPEQVVINERARTVSEMRVADDVQIKQEVYKAAVGRLIS